MNRVIAGDYKDKFLQLSINGKVSIYLGFGKIISIDKQTVLRYELVGQQSKTGFSAGKAVLGAAAFGDVGVLAGVDGKQKNTYQVSGYSTTSVFLKLFPLPTESGKVSKKTATDG